MDGSESSQQKSESESSLSQCPDCGLKTHGIEHIDSRYKCIFCLLIIEDPIQLTACGHRACRGCFESRAAMVADGNVTCPSDACHLITNKDEIMYDRAFKKELDVIPVVCIHRIDRQCNWTGQLKNYQLHLDQNHIHHICSACDERFSSKTVLNEHMTKTCPVIFMLCPLSSLCSQEMIRRDMFLSHLLSEKHQEAINNVVTGKTTFQELLNPEQEENKSISYNKELEQEASEKLNTLSNNIQKLNDENIELSRDYIRSNHHLNTAIEELNTCHTSIIDEFSIKNSIQLNQEKLQKDLEQLQETYDNNHHTSTDGTLLWRIDHVSQKIADAQSERQTDFYSPVFYSSPTGYKMRGRIYLFGDGNARRSHVSLFFSLMKGEYDAILQWPFNHKIAFCLLDQTGNHRHVIDAFHPDIKSNSFRRPQTETNVASGIPKLFPLTMIQQDNNAYVRENTMYIKILVQHDQTSKLMLPFMLSLNPALPNHIQDNLIRQESVKQQQQQSTVDNNTSAISQTTLMNTGNS